MVVAEKSVLVNILYNPEALFVRHTETFKKVKQQFLKQSVSNTHLHCIYVHVVPVRIKICNIILHVYSMHVLG